MTTCIGFHVTRALTLPRIRREGLEPALPPDCPDLKAVFFFSSREAMEDGLLNWLGDRFADAEKIVALEIDLAGLDVVATCEWEWMVGTTVAPDRIRRVWDV